MKKFTLGTNESGMGRPVLIMLIIAAVLAIGGAGYMIGKTKAENDAQTTYSQQVESLQKKVNDAKTNATDKLEDGKDSVESIQSENETLKAKVDDLTKQVADLQQQLEDANSTTPPTN